MTTMVRKVRPTVLIAGPRLNKESEFMVRVRDYSAGYRNGKPSLKEDLMNMSFDIGGFWSTGLLVYK